ncbi:Methyltransf-21 domain-containing protein [Aphelenchoides besseyi]|nr:Methyltransf-21 domain-containing protein [Aphelenchoides besseyi]
MVPTRILAPLGFSLVFACLICILYIQTSLSRTRNECLQYFSRNDYPCFHKSFEQNQLNNSSYESVEEGSNLANILNVVNSVVDKPCRRNTGILVQRMRDTQRQITSFFQSHVPNITERWELLPQVFGAAMNGFRYALKPFKFYSQDEFKHFLEFSNPQSECNHYTFGVGGSWDGEKALRRKYPQCRMTGVDPVGELSRGVVESDPNSRFILAAVSDHGGNQNAHVKGANFAYAQKNKIPHRAFTELLMNENEGRVIDFMTIDVEGAEFVLMKDLHRKRAELPIICQFNVEVHYKSSRYGVTWEQFDRNLMEMFNEAHFIVLNVDQRTFKYRRLFMFNIGDDECIQKFLC